MSAVGRFLCEQGKQHVYISARSVPFMEKPVIRLNFRHAIICGQYELPLPP